jgi:hypothetical protein
VACAAAANCESLSFRFTFAFGQVFANENHLHLVAGDCITFSDLGSDFSILSTSSTLVLAAPVEILDKCKFLTAARHCTVANLDCQVHFLKPEAPRPITPVENLSCARKPNAL